MTDLTLIEFLFCEAAAKPTVPSVSAAVVIATVITFFFDDIFLPCFPSPRGFLPTTLRHRLPIDNSRTLKKLVGIA